MAHHSLSKMCPGRLVTRWRDVRNTVLWEPVRLIPISFSALRHVSLSVTTPVLVTPSTGNMRLVGGISTNPWEHLRFRLKSTILFI